MRVESVSTTIWKIISMSWKNWEEECEGCFLLKERGCCWRLTTIFLMTIVGSLVDKVCGGGSRGGHFWECKNVGNCGFEDDGNVMGARIFVCEIWISSRQQLFVVGEIWIWEMTERGREAVLLNVCFALYNAVQRFTSYTKKDGGLDCPFTETFTG